MNSLKVRLPKVIDWLNYAKPDVLCIQETKLSDAAFPHSVFEEMGYSCAHNGVGRWNGVAILSRIGLELVSSEMGGMLSPDGVLEPPDGVPEPPVGVLEPGRFLAAKCGDYRIASLYVPNGRSVDSEHFEAKLNWLDALASYAKESASTHGSLVLCGDFNVAPDDRDVWDVEAFAGATHVSPQERQALQKVLDAGLVDAFRLLYDQDRLFTWWDYRAGGFHRHLGMRIDLILLSAALAGNVSWALIDRNARKNPLPSDHAPVVVELSV